MFFLVHKKYSYYLGEFQFVSHTIQQPYVSMENNVVLNTNMDEEKE